MVIKVKVVKKQLKVLSMNLEEKERMESFFDGGVYVFYLGELCLYVGETSSFIERLSEHISRLKENASYFGLGRLKGEYSLKFRILKRNLPYAEIDNGEDKRNSDANRNARKNIELMYINKRFPILQNPNRLKDKKTDAMPTSYDKRDNIVMKKLSQLKV